jgi:hypothetical protein
MSENNYDFVRPDHYKKGDMEVWEMMLAIWGPEAFVTHCEMTAFKYRMRMGDKPGEGIEQDLKKAKWYETKAKEYKELLEKNKNEPQKGKSN